MADPFGGAVGACREATPASRGGPAGQHPSWRCSRPHPGRLGGL